MKFTKFGVWESEVQTLIEHIVQKTTIEKNELQDWLYSKGIVIFHDIQKDLYQKDMINCKTDTSHGLYITSSEMLGLKFQGFMAILPGFVEKFAQKYRDQKEKYDLMDILTREYNLFLSAAVGLHLPFYSLQADITNQLNQELAQNPKIDVYQFVVNKFQEFVKTHPEFKVEIENHLLLMKEYHDYLENNKATELAIYPYKSSIFSEKPNGDDKPLSTKLSCR